MNWRNYLLAPVFGLVLSLGLPRVANAGEPAARSTATDPGLPADPGLNLRTVVDKASARNPNQEVLSARVAQADALRLQARSPLAANPSLSLSHYDDVPIDNNGAQEWETGVELPLWMPRQRAARLRVAAATGENARTTGAALRGQVAGLVRESLWEIALLIKQLRLVELQRDTARHLEADVAKRVRYGDLARSDLILAQQETVAREPVLSSLVPFTRY